MSAIFGSMAERTKLYSELNQEFQNTQTEFQNAAQEFETLNKTTRASFYQYQEGQTSTSTPRTLLETYSKRCAELQGILEKMKALHGRLIKTSEIFAQEPPHSADGLETVRQIDPSKYSLWKQENEDTLTYSKTLSSHAGAIKIQQTKMEEQNAFVSKYQGRLQLLVDNNGQPVGFLAKKWNDWVSPTQVSSTSSSSSTEASSWLSLSYWLGSSTTPSIENSTTPGPSSSSSSSSSSTQTNVEPTVTIAPPPSQTENSTTPAPSSSSSSSSSSSMPTLIPHPDIPRPTPPSSGPNTNNANESDKKASSSTTHNKTIVKKRKTNT